MKYFILAVLAFSVSPLLHASKRFYAVDIVSFATPMGTAFTTVIPSSFTHADLIPTDASGVPKYSFALVLVSTDAAGQSAVNAIPGVTALPLKLLTDGLTNTEINQIKNYLNNHGLDGSDIPNGITLGQILKRITDKMDLLCDFTQMDAN